jgi:hypothetical protein
MAKPKKPTVKSVTTEFEEYKSKTRALIFELQYPKQRRLLSVVAADEQGKLNGMTIVELITVTQLSANQGEKVFLSVHDKTISLVAEKMASAKQ